MKKLLVLSLFIFHYSLFIQAQNINTIAGGGSVLGDGGPATSAKLMNPIGVITDTSGNLYIADYGANRVRMVNLSGTITTVAGTGTSGYNGDNIAATTANISGPGGLGIDSAGDIYLPELVGYRVRKLTVSTGIITTVAGTGVGGSGGDGGQATSAQLSFPTDIKFDSHGNMFISDEDAVKVRMVNTSGIINTIAGNGVQGFSGDGGFATLAEMQYPTASAIDANGNVFIGDQGNSRIRMVNTNDTISTYAGNGSAGYFGDGGPATSAELNHPEAVVVDAMKNLYIDDEGNSAIRMVNPSGTISTVAGNGIGGFYGDGGPATLAELSGPQGVGIDKSGNIYITDFDNSRVRKVTNMLTSIKQIQAENDVVIYPNPANNRLSIQLNGIKEKVNISIYTIFGQEVLKQESITPDGVQLNIEALSDGAYILKIQQQDGSSIIRKFEVSR